MRSLRGVWQSWPRTLRWALAISLAAHLLVILPLGIWLYATPVAMPQAPLSAVLKGPGEVTHPASREAQHHVPLSAGEKAKPVVAKRLVPTLSKKEADRALEKPQAVTPVTTGTAQGDPSVTPNAASRSGVQGGAPDTARDGVDADALQRYRLALAQPTRAALVAGRGASACAAIGRFARGR